MLFFCEVDRCMVSPHPTCSRREEFICQAPVWFVCPQVFCMTSMGDGDGIAHNWKLLGVEYM